MSERLDETLLFDVRSKIISEIINMKKKFSTEAEVVDYVQTRTEEIMREYESSLVKDVLKSFQIKKIISELEELNNGDS